MYTYMEQMWRLSASERAELKVKHGHTSRFARDIRTNARHATRKLFWFMGS